MKKIFSRLAVVACLFFLQVPYSYSQDTKKKDRPTTTDKEDVDNTAELPEEGDAPPPPPVHVKERVKLGVEGGPNISLLNIGSDMSTGTLGGTLGGYANIRMVGKFYVQPGIYYVMNGGYDIVIPRISPAGHDLRINTVEVPVTIAYKTGKQGDHLRFTVGVTGYYGYHAGGELNGVKLEIGNNSDDDIKAMEIGVGANVGLELSNGLFFHVKWQRGVSDLKTDAAYSSVYTESYAATIGCYLFGRKHYRRINRHGREYVEPRM